VKKIISTLYKNRQKSVFTNQNTVKLLYYGLKLKIGEITGKIYIKKKYVSKFTINPELLNESLKFLDSSMRKTLAKMEINNTVDFDNNKGFENVGMGSLFIPHLFGKAIAFTQKDASFYFKTREKKPLTLTINLVAIPKINGDVKFEDTKIGEFSCSTFSERQLNFRINPELIIQDISKITISTEKCWSPRYVLGDIPDFPLGVGIKSMNLS